MDLWNELATPTEAQTWIPIGIASLVLFLAALVAVTVDASRGGSRFPLLAIVAVVTVVAGAGATCAVEYRSSVSYDTQLTDIVEEYIYTKHDLVALEPLTHIDTSSDGNSNHRIEGKVLDADGKGYTLAVMWGHNDVQPYNPDRELPAGYDTTTHVILLTDYSGVSQKLK